MHSEPDPLPPEAVVGPHDRTPRRVLVLVDAALDDMAELPGDVRALLERADRVLVVTPSLTTRLQWLVSDIDASRDAAAERLRTVLGHLQRAAVDATGSVADDATAATIDDRVSTFNPDHIVIALRGGKRAGRQDSELLAGVESRAGVPMTVFTVAGGHVVGPRPS